MKIESIKESQAFVPGLKTDGKKEPGDFTIVLDALLALLPQPVQQSVPPEQPEANVSGEELAAAQLSLEHAVLALLPVQGEGGESEQKQGPLCQVAVPIKAVTYATEPLASQVDLEFVPTSMAQQPALGAVEFPSPKGALGSLNEALELATDTFEKRPTEVARRLGAEPAQTSEADDTQGAALQLGPVSRNVEPILRPMATETLSALRAEIISFSSNPSRPAVVLEVNPPEYGKVLVRAEQAEGQVIIRLVVDNTIAKEQVLTQLPKVQTSAEVVVVTAEEYREQQESLGSGDRERQQRRQQPREGKKDTRFELLI